MEPRYIRIAIDLAESIAEKELVVGTKISGRSVLASRYNVSPETIRKAIALLKDYEIVSSSPKKGIEILNEENAADFLREIKASKTYDNAKKRLEDLLEEQQNINQEIRQQIKILLELKKKPRHANRFFPYELIIPEESHLNQQTIGQTSFWDHTGATIVRITRRDKTFLSPGPDFKFRTGDHVFFVCKDHNYSHTRSFIETKKQTEQK